MNPRVIMLTLAYDGTKFHGWQIQKEKRTVQSVLEKALLKIHEHPVRITGAGRTDSGVHASGQVAHFTTDKVSISGDKFREALNANLPRDVRVIRSREAPSSFHARFSAINREYRYFIYNVPVGLPHFRNYCWRIQKKLNLHKLNKFASCIAGTHDFTSFSCVSDSGEKKIREVTSSCFYRQGDFLIYRIKARSFLWKMVRNIVGTVIDFELHQKTQEEFIDLFDAKDRTKAGRTAPARGLFLERVEYE